MKEFSPVNIPDELSISVDQPNKRISPLQKDIYTMAESMSSNINHKFKKERSEISQTIHLVIWAFAGLIFTMLILLGVIIINTTNITQQTIQLSTQPHEAQSVLTPPTPKQVIKYVSVPVIIQKIKKIKDITPDLSLYQLTKTVTKRRMVCEYYRSFSGGIERYFTTCHPK